MDIKSINKYIGIPFEDGGRTMNGADCFGLVKVYYQNEKDIDLEDYAISALDTVKISNQFSHEKKTTKQWEEIKEPEEGCIILINIRNNPDIFCDHIGVYMGNDYFLHAYSKSNSALSHLSKWKSHVRGYYRYIGGGETKC